MQQAGPVNRSFKVNYNYDQWNNTLEETEFNLNLNKQNTTTIKYEFDLKNNWIKKTIWYNMVLTVIAEREIKYYE